MAKNSSASESPSGTVVRLMRAWRAATCCCGIGSAPASSAHSESGRERAPNLLTWDRLMAGLCALFIKPARLFRSAIVLKPSTLLNFHRQLKKRRYRLLFSPKWSQCPGPKSPAKELIDAVLQMKRRNRVGDALESRNRSRWLSASKSTRMLFDGFWPIAIGRNQEVLRG